MTGVVNQKELYRISLKLVLGTNTLVTLAATCETKIHLDLIERQPKALQKILFLKKKMVVESDDRIADKMGSLLLSGWTMLNETCNTCICPMFENKKTAVKMCPQCVPAKADDVKQQSLAPIKNNSVSITKERPKCEDSSLDLKREIEEITYQLMQQIKESTFEFHLLELQERRIKILQQLISCRQKLIDSQPNK